MSNTPRPTKNERREAAREAARIEREKQKKRETRNKVLVRGGVSLGILAIVGVIALVVTFVNQPAGPGPRNMASDGVLMTGADGAISVVKTAGVAEGGSPTYTDQASLDTEVDIVAYVDYLCPYCGQFETTNAEQIEEWVAAGIASYEIHPISILDRLSLGTEYSTRAANAAACVAAEEPDSFLDFHNSLFANQPAENTSGLTTAELTQYAADAGADSDAVASCISGVDYEEYIADATDRALDEDIPYAATGSPVTGTPTVVVNGQLYSGSLTDAGVFATFVEALRGEK